MTYRSCLSDGVLGAGVDVTALILSVTKLLGLVSMGIAIRTRGSIMVTVVVSIILVMYFKVRVRVGEEGLLRVSRILRGVTVGGIPDGRGGSYSERG